MKKRFVLHFTAILLLISAICCGCTALPAQGSVTLQINGNTYTALSVEDYSDPTFYDNQLVAVQCTQDGLKTCRLTVDGAYLQDRVVFTVFDEKATVLTKDSKNFSLPNAPGVYYICIGIDWGNEENHAHTDSILKFKLTN